MSSEKRWILLEHVGSPDDPQGVHFDLLLEDQNGCRSWRLSRIPVLDGPAQIVSVLPVHRLHWLDHSSGEVSGGRGWARRVMAGLFYGELPSKDADAVKIELHSKGTTVGTLEIKNCVCTLCSLKNTRLY